MKKERPGTASGRSGAPRYGVPKRSETSFFRLGRVAACALAASGIPLSQAQDTTAPAAPVIDDTTNELDATIVTAAPAAPASAAPSQRVRPATASRPVEVEVYSTIEPEVILGGPAETHALPGSGYFVTTQEIRDFNYTNVNRVLAGVPGVYLREEDGAGLFPNISIRGVDGTRNEKITVMEDGILQGPAPYSAPSAYYSPNVARMAGVEILKGSSQIGYGPNTTGGVINFLSTPIPEQEQFYLRSTYGSNATAQIHSHYGDTIETEAGRFGYLAEIFYKRSDGFRRVEGAPMVGIPASDSGYSILEPMVKFSWEPNSYLDQKFEFKYGYSDIEADESYLGLTDADFKANPYRRYAGSYLDTIPTEHHRTYLKYSVSPNDDLDLRLAGYYNQFERNWFKIRNVNGNALHTALGPTGDPLDLLTLKGLAPGNLGYRHNARSYESYGAQFSGDYRFETGDIGHTVNFGVRYHEDSIRTFQENTNVTLVAGGRPIVTDLGPGTGGNSYQDSTATAVWIKDDVKIGRLTVTPGIRYESVDLHYTNYAADATNTVTGTGYGDIDWVVSGIGLNYELNDVHSVFGGVHEGIAIPSPGDSLAKPPILPEESVSYELGVRHRSGNFNAELTGFLTDFSQIISTSTGLGLTGPVNNAGTGQVHGIEALASYDPLQGRDLRLPLFVSSTWTSATLDQALDSGAGENIYGDGDGGPGIPGAEMPYIPEWKVAVGVGLETDRWGVDLAATYVSDTFGTALNSPVPVTSSRQGEVDGGVIVDLGAYYQINETTKLIGGVHNLFEEVMITSRVPEGARVNAPREFYIGFEMLWEPRAVPAGGKSVVSK